MRLTSFVIDNIPMVALIGIDIAIWCFVQVCSVATFAHVCPSLNKGVDAVIESDI